MAKLRTVIGVVSALLLSACSSQPRQVNANLPLVSERTSPIGTPIDQQYWSDLNQDHTLELIHPKYFIFAQEAYTSALGIKCRTLKISPLNESTVTSSNTIERTVCQHATKEDSGSVVQGWFLIKDIVENSAVVEI